MQKMSNAVGKFKAMPWFSVDHWVCDWVIKLNSLFQTADIKFHVRVDQESLRFIIYTIETLSNQKHVKNFHSCFNFIYYHVSSIYIFIGACIKQFTVQITCLCNRTQPDAIANVFPNGVFWEAIHPE